MEQTGGGSVAEMAAACRWLGSRPDTPKRKPMQSRRAKKAVDVKKSARAKKTVQRKKEKNPLNGARPLPGVGDPRPKKKPK
ncbi:hypothetical protein ACFYW9_30355 [Streptomyces sp. NPDC002698]|uniref:hypothetical protein n=1 Tax=Streptomyces sp. NPDC002698 TaxID=3364660 RepID=UPI003687F27D